MRAAWFGLALTLVTASCSETRDLGSSSPHGLLPVDERNPVILLNDGAYDNWHCEYAVLLANGGGPKLVGIVVNTQAGFPDLDTSVAGWQALVDAARKSGLRDIPDPVKSASVPLTRPSNDDIASTTPNNSDGARFIRDVSARLSLPYRPVVVATGGRLTDIADAYLIDPTVTERVVVVSSLGEKTASGGIMDAPNGQLDPWASTIVGERFRYVQVSTWYDQMTDVPVSRLSERPTNAFGDWVAAKQPNLLDWIGAADQVSVESFGIPGFTIAVERVASAGIPAAGATSGPKLVLDPNGHGWLVTQIASDVAIARFWQLFRDPKTYHP
jgi:hypothetical protein